MKAECEKCRTEFSLDDDLVGPDGATVRCGKCKNVFVVGPVDKVPAKSDRWLLRQSSGVTFSFDHIDILKKWILDGKVKGDDNLSREGEPWKRVGDVMELAALFEKDEPEAKASDRPVGAGFAATRPGGRADTVRVVGDSRGSGLPSARTIPADPTRPGIPLAQPQPSTGTSSRSPVDETYQLSATMPASKSQQRYSGGPSKKITLQNAGTEKFDPRSTAQGRIVDEQEERRPVPLAQPVPKSPRPDPASQLGTGTIRQVGDREARKDEDNEPDLSQVPPLKEEVEWDQGAGVKAKSPAWTERPSVVENFEDDDLDPLTRPKRKVGRWIVLVASVLLLGTAFYMVMFQSETTNRLVGSIIKVSSSDRDEKFYLSGRENFLLDSVASYRQADREFQKALALNEKHAPTLGALAELYAVWAQYVKDQELDAKADAVAAAAEKGGEPDFGESARLEEDFKEKLAEAVRWSDQAMATDPNLAEVQRAAAEVKRLSGRTHEAEKHLNKSTSLAPDAETRYASAMLALDTGARPDEIAHKLDRLVKEAPLCRAMYRSARLMANAGRNEEAKKTLASLFELNSDHDFGHYLEARIDAKKPIPIAASEAVKPSEEAEDAGPPEPKQAEQVEKAERKPEPAPATEPQKAKAPAVGAGGGGNVGSLLTQAVKLQERGKTTEAIALFERVLETSPNNVDALSGLGYCYLDRGAHGQAIASFRRVLNANPVFGPALLGLAQTYKAQGRKDQALVHFEKYLENNPSGRYSGMAKRNVEMLKEEEKADEEKAGDADGKAGSGSAVEKPGSDTGGSGAQPISVSETGGSGGKSAGDVQPE